jgi:TolB-like protein/tRNA A-37 threonylcarbamoyl transferase component Bud32/Flp pilus assembly protein TadD
MTSRQQVANELERLTAALAGRYRVERELGRGGMATVYLAHDLKHDRRVALKVLRPELAHALGPERFLREIRLTAQLDHPHILALLDSDEADGILYYAMPYVEGESLRDRLTREKQLPVGEALQIARDVADALSCAHVHGIVHRDIKPENVLLAGRHARVADFGIARALSAAGTETLTETGLAIGTPAYMSPEQAGGERDLDGRSDVYALGCVLYEMLAGHPPFTGRTAYEILARHSMDAVPSLAAARPTVSPELERTIATALAKSPADRFLTAAQFAEALARPESTAAPAAAPGRPSRPVRRMVLLAGAALAAGGVLLVLRSGQVGPAPERRTYERTAIAVLPFQNLTADGPNAYFAGGLHDELLTQLSKVAALRVISRTSVMGYAGMNVPLKRIASELAVGSVVEGSVQVADGRLRVNVQLIDAATDAPLWAERYDRTLEDAFAIQSDVAQQIVAAVGAALSAAEREVLAVVPTANAEAYRLYLQGREYHTGPGLFRQRWEIAQQLYERALALDPEFGLARAALSEVHGMMYWFRHDPSPTRAARQLGEAAAALQLAPNLPQAHVAMGLVYLWGRRDYPRALEEFRVALKGLPNDAGIYSFIAAAERRLGNWDQVLAAFQKATQLNPRDANLSPFGGYTYVLMRRYPEAVRAFDRALSLTPDLHNAAMYRGWTYVQWQGQLDTLRAVLNRLPQDADLGEFDTRTAQHLRLLHWERQGDSMLQVLRTAGGIFKGRSFFLPASLYTGWAHRFHGDYSAALAAFDSARLLLDSVIIERPTDWRVHAARGLALAGLRRRDEALREANWLQQSWEYGNDAVDGPQVAEARAGILAQAGQPDSALLEIERLLARPSEVSLHTLRLDPLWDPIRERPRFQGLLTRLGHTSQLSSIIPASLLRPLLEPSTNLPALPDE